MRGRWSGRFRLVVVVSVAAVLGAAAPVGTTVAQAQEPAYTVEVSPSSSGLVDGQAIQVLVRAAPGHRLGDSGIVRTCRDGVTYETLDDVNPLVGGNCPDKPVTSSASDPWPIRSYPDGSAAVTAYRVGAGTVAWGPAEDNDRFSLRCDTSSACRLVIAFTLDGRDVIDASTLLTYTNPNPAGACGGTAPDALSSTGPDRLSAMWVALTRHKCSTEGTQASSLAVLSGEGEGHDAFEQGRADLTYSAVGPRFPGRTATEERPSVSVPFALNATVIGVLGGYPSSAPDWPKFVPKPYGDLKVTMSEMAILFGQGRYLFDAFAFDAVQQRNPELVTAQSLTNNDRGNPLAPAGSEAISWQATSAFDTLAGPQWISPPQDIDGNEPNAPRGVHDTLALADPPFTFSLFELYSSSGQLKRLVADFAFRPYSYGPIWVLTDLATARELGIPTVALQNSSGEFVQPTEASMLAAVPSLETQADGTSLPVVGAEGPGAYPLTFVEHAVAPTDALVDADCVARPGSQQQLAAWMTYLTGPGQAVLPDGLVPVPSSLASGTAARLAALGTTQATRCAPDPTDPPPEPPGAELPPGQLPDGGSFGPPGGGSDLPTPSSFNRAATAGGAGIGPGGGSDSGPLAESGLDGEGAEDEVALAEIAYPDPTSGGGGNGVATALALVVLAVLVAVGGFLSSGRRPNLPGLPGRSR